MKNILKFTFITLFTVIISSCSSDEPTKEESYLYKSEKINFTEIINNQTGKTSKSTNNTDDYFHSIFETNFQIPTNLDNSELESYVSSNIEHINGTIKYFLNDNEFISVDIINGQKMNVSVSKNNPFSKGPGDFPCSYDGIQDCTQAAIDDWHPITAVICSFGALACVYEEIAICVSENCIEN